MGMKYILLIAAVLCMMGTDPGLTERQSEMGMVNGQTETRINAQTVVCNDVQTEVLYNHISWLVENTQTVVALRNDGGEILFDNAAASAVIRLVNDERTQYGLQPLKISAALMDAARIRAEEVAVHFSHTRPDGTAWSTVSPQVMGENIARGHESAQRVMAAWMSSEGHRKNILRAGFGSIGVCAVQINGVQCWVQLFGK